MQITAQTCFANPIHNFAASETMPQAAVDCCRVADDTQHAKPLKHWQNLTAYIAIKSPQLQHTSQNSILRTAACDTIAEPWSDDQAGSADLVGMGSARAASAG